MSSTKSTIANARSATPALTLAFTGLLVLTGLLALSSPAHAQDATWDVTPGTNDFNTGANWTPNTVPTGVAFLSFSNTTTLGFSANTILGGITMGTVTPAYVLNNFAGGNTIVLEGAGITNGDDLTINLQGIGSSSFQQSRIFFTNNATAGSSTINQLGGGSFVVFFDSSSAGTSILTSSGSGRIGFSGDSSAGNANITTTAGGTLLISGATATAENATITNGGFLTIEATASAGNSIVTNLTGGDAEFSQSSTAENATITNQTGGDLKFFDSSNAGAAAFDNSGLFYFHDASDAQNAAISNNAGGTLWFNQTSTANNATIANLANGEVRFRNKSTAGAATILNSGDLDFYHDSTAGTAAISNDGDLAFLNDSTAGNSTITNQGVGTLTFSDSSSAENTAIINSNNMKFENTSTAANATISNSGNIGFEDTATAGIATFTTQNGGATFFTDNSSGGTSRQIVETGGVLDISGLTSTTISFGSIEGAGTIDLGTKGMIVGSLNTDTEFSGVISGSGGLGKQGTGVLTLSGTNTYTDDTVVIGGTLIVNGTVVSNVIVQGGTLGGTGNVNSAGIGGNAIHAPGNSIGTQTVNGSYFNSGTLQIEVDDQGNGDKVIVNGAVEIAGASLQIIELAGSWGKDGDAFEYVIIENDGNDAVNGSFASITNSLAFLTATVSTTGGDGNDVVLTLARNGVQFVEVAQTPNQKAVATALANGPLLTNDPDVKDALLGLSAQSARNAFDLLSGEVHASSAHTMMAVSRTLTGMAGERLWNAGNGSGGGENGSQGPAMMGLTGSATQLYNNRTNLGGRMPNDAQMNVGGDVGGLDGGFGAAAQDPSLYQRFAMWVRGYGERSQIDDDGNAAELDARSGGIIGGGDVALTQNLRAGIMGHWGTTNGDVDERLSSFDINTRSVAAYAGYASGPFLFKGLAGYSHHDIDTTRTISFGSLNRTAISDYSANQAILYSEAAYRMGTPDFALMPLAALRWSRANFDGFSEAGAGSVNLTAHSHSESRLESILGLRLATTIKSDGLTWLPQARIGWVHAYGDLTPDIDFSFEGGGDFTIAGTTGARNALTLSAGLNVANGTGLTGFVDYSTNLSGIESDHALSGGLRSEF